MCLFTSARTVAIVFARSGGSEAMYCAGVLTFDGGFMDSSSFPNEVYQGVNCWTKSRRAPVASSWRNPPRGQTCCGRRARVGRREFAPGARAVTAANVPDILQLEPLVAALPAVADGPGRPRRKPGAVQDDRAYWSRARHARLA